MRCCRVIGPVVFPEGDKRFASYRSRTYLSSPATTSPMARLDVSPGLSMP